MSIATRPIDYDHNGVALEGVLAFDDAFSGPRPLVLVSHAWAGRSDFEVEIAKRIAGLGYAGFALDLYGKGVLGASVEENQALMTPFVEDRSLLQARLLKALETAAAEPETDSANAAAIGYCFGGLCVLDMARMGAPVKGVASFHGLFMPPASGAKDKIDAKVIAFHGWDDPMAKPEDAQGFATEMTNAKADWQLQAYGGVMHAFTNPAANDPSLGTVYNETAEKRSWTALQSFLEECFA